MSSEQDNQAESTDAKPEDKVLERWNYNHPRFGVVEVLIGTREQVREIDPGFPEKALDLELSEATNLVVKQQGTVIARRTSLSDQKFELKDEPEELDKDKLDYPVAMLGAPFIEIQSSLLDSWVHTVRIKMKGTPSIFLEAPPGSRGAKRQRAMEESPFKRWAFPLIAGMGKGVWALFCLVLLPLIGKIIEPIVRWLTQFIPDWEFPWPDIHLPSIPWPEINLPRIPWPDINLPSIPWPDITVPDWVLFLMEYYKVWVPVIIGLTLGIRAVKSARLSREEKLKDKQREIAGLLRGRMLQLEHP